MVRRENRIDVGTFDVDVFKQSLSMASGADEHLPFCDQIKYLARYCRRLGAKTVIHEHHYIDRHFVDEHALYYCRNLEQPPNSVHRFHLFSKEISDAEFSELLDRAVRTPRESALQEQRQFSQDYYLGFISIRPLPSVPVGRTVLRPLGDGDPREISTPCKYDVHLANLALNVEGLAFQQQDLAVGACATAALWSALSRVMRTEGMRAPTPAEVSVAASRHILENGRAVPAVSGLTVQQLSEAIRSCGLEPEAVRANERPEYVVAALHAYLLSGIPVVLILQDASGGHAVTAVGFQLGGESDLWLETSVPVRSSRIKKIYVHDDTLGPYAKAILRPLPRTLDTDEALVLEIEELSDGKMAADAAGQASTVNVESWLVDSIVAPVYPKLRLSVASLMTLAELLGGLIERFVDPADAVQLGVEFYYERAGTYLSKLSGKCGPAPAFFRTVALPRWCGVIRWFIGDRPLAEFVYDTTDILRDRLRLGSELLRAVVCLDPAHAANVRELAENVFQVPHVGPLTP